MVEEAEAGRTDPSPRPSPLLKGRGRSSRTASGSIGHGKEERETFKFRVQSAEYGVRSAEGVAGIGDRRSEIGNGESRVADAGFWGIRDWISDLRF